VGHEVYASRDSVGGYLTALECMQAPYDVLATSHLGELGGYRVIVLPWPMIVRRVAAAALAAWVEAGGTLVFETQLDAFDEVGLYRYAPERPFAQRLGITGLGRRPMPTEAVTYNCDGVTGELPVSSWIEPFEGHAVEALAVSEHGTVVARRTVGAGEAIAIGTHAGRAYRAERSRDFERLLGAILERASALPALRCDVQDGERLQWRQGRSGEHDLLFVTNAGPAGDVSFTGPPGVFREATNARDLLTGRTATLVDQPDAATLHLRVDAGGSHVIQLWP
jgi:beta-galactosidase